MIEFLKYEKLWDEFMVKVCEEDPDSSHDILHVRRVVALAKTLGQKEKGKLEVIIPAAYLHDCVYICKTDKRRSLASTISAEKAIELLKEWSYPNQYYDEIFHAIAAHSFSANIKAESLEAQIVQDADRLDALGAIGIARCFAFTGLAKISFYNDEDPFAQKRELNDRENTLDHFYLKLLKLEERLNTDSGKIEGRKRTAIMKTYIEDLKREIIYANEPISLLSGA